MDFTFRKRAAVRLMKEKSFIILQEVAARKLMDRFKPEIYYRVFRYARFAFAFSRKIRIYVYMQRGVLTNLQILC